MQHIAPVSVPFYAERTDECMVFEHTSAAICHCSSKVMGCRKPLVEYMAARLERPLVTVSCHDDLSAADLVGRFLIGNGETIWSDGPLARAVRAGYHLLPRRSGRARKTHLWCCTVIAMTGVLLPIERTGEQLQAAPGFMLVMSYNPGYQNVLKGLKTQHRQRFIGAGHGLPGT